VVSLEAHVIAGEHCPADLNRLFKHVEAHAVARILDAEALMLDVVPSSPMQGWPAREMMSSVVTILAKMPGLRYVTPVTRVRAAPVGAGGQRPSNVYASSIGSFGPPKGGNWKKWSMTHTESNRTLPLSSPGRPRARRGRQTQIPRSWAAVCRISPWATVLLRAERGLTANLPVRSACRHIRRSGSRHRPSAIGHGASWASGNGDVGGGSHIVVLLRPSRQHCGLRPNRTDKT